MTPPPDDAAIGYPDVVTRPTLAVVARPGFDWPALNAFVGDRPKALDMADPRPHGGAASLVEACGRLCYDSWDRGRATPDYIARLIAAGHLSVLEHAQYTVLVRGVSRTLLAELTRHRHASFSVRSQRYCDESACRFVVPPDLPPADFDRWLAACRRLRTEYRRLLAGGLANGLDRKQAHGMARSVLPGCTETTLALTLNARAARELLPKRLSPAAEPEIARFGGLLAALLHAECPLLFAGLGGAACP
jgi:thymidylate synthase (FAD)